MAAWVAVMISDGSEISYHIRISLCLNFSLIRRRATSLDSQLLGLLRAFGFSTTFCIPLRGVSAGYDGVISA